MAYPAFAPGKEGFPRTGEVVKYYRERKMDHEGYSYTQSHLAQVLGISEQAIRDLENKDASMDDFGRRQFLSKWLAIPPILLGIITRDEIDKLVEQWRAATSGMSVVSTPLSTSHKLLIDPKEYRDQLVLYWNTNHSHTAYASLANMLLRIDALYRELPHVRDKKPIQELLCEYHQFVAHLYRDQQKYDDAIECLEKAYFFAEMLNRDELKALVLHRQGRTFENAGRIGEAVCAYTKARKYERGLSGNLNGSMLLHAGLVDARDAKTEKARDAAISLLDRVGNLVRTHLDADDPYFLDLSLDRYHLTRSAALIAVGRNKGAINELKLVKCGSEYPRAQAYNEILEAQAQLNLGEYSEAARLAASSLIVVQKINSEVNIARIEKIFQQLLESPYKNSPDVGHLDWLLHYKRRSQ